MRILVTGGAGFIGSHCADAFIQAGHNVIITDNLLTGKRDNIPTGSRFIKMDIRQDGLREIFKNEMPECICHHAAQVSVRNSVNDPIEDAEINIIGGVNLLKCAIEFNVKTFIFASTGGAIYGEQVQFPAGESHPLRPVCPYGVSKLSFEKYVEYFHRAYGLNYCILRYSNVYGPRQDPFGETGVVAIFSQMMLEEKQPVINGDGDQTRDFIYVSDVARANLMALEQKFNQCFNIGTGHEITINTIFNVLNKFTGGKSKQVHGPPQEGEQRRSCISPQLAKEYMGWSPEVSLEEGLSLTVDYFKKVRSS